MSVEHTNWDDDPYIGSAAYQRERDAFDALTDDDIDVSDIPPLTDDQLSEAVRNPYRRPRTAEAQDELDADVVAWFRQRYPAYQTAMNAVLRAYMDAHEDEDTASKGTDPDHDHDHSYRKTA
ncbi:MAG: BrnA antitoxin family protein [Thermomicrobiales bacterium]